MGTWAKIIVRFILLILVQFFVLDKIQLHHLVTPYIYFLFVLWMPFDISRPLQLLLAFALGLTLDAFRHHPGFHAAACVLIAYVRPYLIGILISQDTTESSYSEPSVKSMGGRLSYFVYVGILTIIHNAWLFFLQATQFGDFWYFIVKTFLSALISFALIAVSELFFTRKQKYRTNTA